VIVSPRVFKYANKGYGIRILPSYLEALAKINPDDLPREKSNWTWKDQAILGGKEQFSLEARIANAREYFERIFEVYMRWSNNGRDLQPSNINGAWKGTSLRPTGQDLPVFTHALLDTRDQLTTQPQPRSCLTGFELLYRLAFVTHAYIYSPLFFFFFKKKKACGPLGSGTSRSTDYTGRRMGEFFRECGFLASSHCSL
jgi:hypothetical protein